MKKLSADDKIIINMLYDQLSECSDGYGYLCDCDTTEVESSLSRLKLCMIVLLKLLCNLGFSMGSIHMPSVSGDKYEDLYDFVTYNETFFTDVMSLFGWEFSFINSEEIVDAILDECGSSFADILLNDSNKFKELFIEQGLQPDGSYGCYYLMSSTEPGADCTSMDYDMTKILDMILAEDYFKQIGL